MVRSPTAHLLLLTFLCIPTGPLQAQDVDFPCVFGRCVDGFGTKHISESRIHTGIWKNGLRSGFGWEVAESQLEAWRGVFSSGSLNGHAEYVRVENGRTIEYYSGSWKNGRRHGYGVYRDRFGGVFEGFHENGVRQGKGRYSSLAQWTYEGEWVSNAWSGRGVLDRPGVMRYEGEWQDSKRHGRGIETFFDGGLLYQGEFRDDVPHGEGKIWLNGVLVYSGRVHPTEGYGFGRVVEKDSLYVGELKDGRPHGRGIERNDNGKIVTGLWAEGDRVSAR